MEELKKKEDTLLLKLKVDNKDIMLFTCIYVESIF